ncbi:MAG: endonuclease Q family protein [Minisyncoccia bacterium]
MRIIADLHIHSKYSRATSKDMDLEHIALAAKEKGINIIATADFTHPLWFKELKEKLEPAEDGLYKLKPKALITGSQKNISGNNQVRFIVSTEISNIYQRGGKTRRIHNLIVLPSLEAAEKINKVLSWQGNLKSDGRPILGLDSEELLKIVFEAEPQAMFIPCHIWTPWFGVFGSMSGFDSLEEAFGENTKYISVLETGLSSDPKMNWRLSKLDNFALVSNSDAHSPNNLGREANVFELDLNYSSLREAILKKDKSKFLFTIEFFPEEGKYHYDGHRLCHVSMSPEERKKVKGICPVCNRPLTIGVLSRVDELADRENGFIPHNAIPFKSLVPLKEIIAETFGVGVNTKLVEEKYRSLISSFENEFNILLDVPLEEILKVTDSEIVEGIKRVRGGNLYIEPGYDGEYGKVKIFKEEEREQLLKKPSQKELF